MAQKKLLLTNCGHSEVPLIVAAHNLGWYVIATGLNNNGVGHSFADESIFGDFADAEFIYNLAKDQKVDAILSGCEDSAYISTAYACDKLNLPGHDSYKNACIIHNKKKFREVMDKIGLPTPNFLICKNVDEAINAAMKITFPLIVKPVDKNSGIGCSTCWNEAELKIAFLVAQKVTTHQEIILERYIQGSNHATNVFFKDKKVIQAFFDNEQYRVNPYLVAGASSPSNLLHYTIEQTIIYLEKIAEYLNLQDGMFHCQFIVDEKGTPYLIDPCRRIPGGLYILLIQYASGFNCAECVVRFETGEKNFILPERWKRRIIAREYITTENSGTIDSIFIDKSIREKIVDRFIWGKADDVVKDPFNYKAGIIFIEFPNFKEMKDALDNFHELVNIKFR